MGLWYAGEAGGFGRMVVEERLSSEAGCALDAQCAEGGVYGRRGGWLTRHNHSNEPTRESGNTFV